ncbi:hypothetical protein [Leptolyngbya ohadii]|uniref:hypothetical protein n=1 Tax=Leptolyngbya ohadii TaxID=1962290 RepID=UPI000B5992C4|nr:hypothetical protein [Leptolyngbya ohadii]
MKARSNRTSVTQNPVPQNPTASAQTSYAPSVPISIYRELAAELDATRALLETVHTENQQLKQQNHQLREEINRLVQSALNLRSYTEPSYPPTESSESPAAIEEFEAVAAQLRSNAAPEPGIPTIAQPTDLTLTLTSETKPRALGGLWLTLTVIAIVIGAFGAGFFMVKPLLHNNR